jgi:hypothetical protein
MIPLRKRMIPLHRKMIPLRKKMIPLHRRIILLPQKMIFLHRKIIFLPQKIVLSVIQTENRRENERNSGEQLKKFIKQNCKRLN